MTDNQIKEAMSREFLRILAFGNGFKVIEPVADHGVDLIVCPVLRRIEPTGRVRFVDSTYKLEFQLKATTALGVLDGVNAIKFDLDVKNYNDLIQRRHDPIPLHLIVVVLASSPPSCVELSQSALTIRASAYWYLPLHDGVASQNHHQIRITVPKANKLRTAFVHERFDQLGIKL